MPVIRYVLSEYVEHAMAQALYDHISNVDKTFGAFLKTKK